MNLAKRFHMYYSRKCLLSWKSISLIYQAIQKYGYSNFSLEILEYCDPSDLIIREQYYIDLLNPKYNICKKAGSCFGRIFSKETRAKISLLAQGRNHSEGTKSKLREARLGVKSSEETRAKLSTIQSTRLKDPNPGREVKVTDIQSGEINIYNSTRSTAKELGTTHTTIRNYIKNKKLFPPRPRGMPGAPCGGGCISINL